MEWISGNVYIRPNRLEKVGDKVEGHKHNFDHTTIVFQGAVHVRAVLPDGTVREADFVSPAHFLVRKDVEHEISALQPLTVFWCVYSHQRAQASVSEENTGWEISQTYEGYTESYQ